MADQVLASGKSKEEIAYLLMHELLTQTSDKPKNPSREDVIKNFMAAREVVYGNPKAAMSWFSPKT